MEKRILPPWVYELIDGTPVVDLGGTKYPVDPSKPPAFLFPSYLEGRLGFEWFAIERALSPNLRHPIVSWFDDYAAFLGAFERQGPLKPYQDIMSPGAVALIILAYDMYTLDRDRLLQKALVKRLLDKRAVQGVLHETSVSATMMRAGFEVLFEDETDSKRKHPEFVAIHRQSKLRVAVEAKSIHRRGVLGYELGNPPPTPGTASAHKIAAQVCGQVERSIPKARGLPLYVFVDLNLPPATVEAVAPALFSEFKEILPQVDTGTDASGVFIGRAMNLLTVTNRPTNLGQLKHTGGDTLHLFLHPDPVDCRYPDASTHVPDVKAAVKNHGTIPDP
jgi:hypothetical protein